MMTPGAGIFRTHLPKGFLAGGANCGVRRYRPDLGVIISEQPCVASGVFTKNTCKAAPVLHCESILPATNIRAIITNSGQANAATGEQGDRDNQAMGEAVAKTLDCDLNQVLTASTGVIGEPMAINKITHAIPALINKASTIAEPFALAILTTDLVPKSVVKTVTLSSGTVTITGICKGSGMIHPNMATMLGYILTDADLTPEQSCHLLSHATDHSFNMISVDGETSTNDSVFLLANGASGTVVKSDADFNMIKTAIESVAIVLAKSIVSDGEGATKLITFDVKNAPDMVMARRVARSLSTSALIKTAIYGESPNWGRILSRIGSEEVPAEILQCTQIDIAGCQVFPAPSNHEALSAQLKSLLKSHEINITVNLCSGKYSATAWGCDLTEKYIKINAEYVT